MTSRYTVSKWCDHVRATAAMKRGTANEAKVERALRSDRHVRMFANIGLVSNTQFKWLGVSADGVAWVRLPNAREPYEHTLASDSIVADGSDREEGDGDLDDISSGDTDDNNDDENDNNHIDDDESDIESDIDHIDDDDDDDDQIHIGSDDDDDHIGASASQCESEDSSVACTDGDGVLLQTQEAVVPPARDSSGVWDAGPTLMSGEVLLPVEIKTMIAVDKLEWARSIRRRWGGYFHVRVGDERWWVAIPAEYRAQVLHQMLVFGVRRGLFVVADETTSPVVFKAYVTATASQMEIYETSLTKWGSLFTWAFAGDDPPPELDADDVEVWMSHLKVSLALRQWVITNNRALPSLRTVKPAVNAAYSIGKSGVDVATASVDLFRSPKIRLKWRQSLVMFPYQTHAHTAVAMGRMLEVANSRSWHWPGLDKFRNQCSKRGAFVDRVVVLVADMMRHAAQLRTQRAEEAAQASYGNVDATEPPMKVARNRLKVWQAPEMMAFRLNGNAGHLHVLQLKKRSRCAVCRKKTMHACKLCAVALCTQVRGDASCTARWHTQEIIEAP